MTFSYLLSLLRRVSLLATVAGAFAIASFGRNDTVGAQSSCGPAVNPIVCENQKPGDPATLWDVGGAGDASIQGFATQISVVPGETVRFKIKTVSSNYRLDIY